MRNSKYHKVWNFLVFVPVLALLFSFLTFFIPALAESQYRAFEFIFEHVLFFISGETMRSIIVLVTDPVWLSLYVMVYAVVQSARGGTEGIKKFGWILLSVVGGCSVLFAFPNPVLTFALVFIFLVLQFTVFKKWDAERFAAKNISN